MWAKFVGAVTDPLGAGFDRPHDEAGEVVLQVQREYRSHDVKAICVPDAVVGENSPAECDMFAQRRIQEDATFGAQQCFAFPPWIEEFCIVSVEGEVDVERESLLSAQSPFGHGHGARQDQECQSAGEEATRPVLG